MKKALIAGASGLVGNELLPILVEGKEYEKIYALVRRPLEFKHPKLEENNIRTFTKFMEESNGL